MRDLKIEELEHVYGAGGKGRGGRRGRRGGGKGRRGRGRSITKTAATVSRGVTRTVTRS